MAWAGDGRRRGDGARGRVTQGIGAPARTTSEARAAPPCASLEDVVLPGGFRRVTAPICDSVRIVRMAGGSREEIGARADRVPS